MNGQTETLFGYTRDEMMGQSMGMLAPGRQGSAPHQHRDDFRRLGSGLELYARKRDGSKFPVEISPSPVATRDGTVVLSVICDISDRIGIEGELRRANQELDRRKTRELRDSENRLALIVDSPQEAIIGKNLDGIITQWNRASACWKNRLRGRP